MAVYPKANYRPLNQFSNGKMHSYRGVVLHVNASNGPSLYNWIAGDNGMSAHFQVAKTGGIEQYVDTSLSSWCQVAGNDDWLSIETEGYPTEALSPQQLQAITPLLAWMHTTHGIPLQLADHPDGTGFGWHGMGGVPWGNHPGCPGELRKGQRSVILTGARALVAPKQPAPSSGPAKPIPKPGIPAWPLPSSHYFGLITGPNESHGGYFTNERQYIKLIQQRLQALGYAPRTPGWADGIYEQPTKVAVATWQRAKWARYTSRYGEVWSDDWKRLFS